MEFTFKVASVGHLFRLETVKIEKKNMALSVEFYNVATKRK